MTVTRKHTLIQTGVLNYHLVNKHKVSNFIMKQKLIPD